ncbi:porin [Paraburkholderia caribensis]|uniref:porin n=1 Tax=Paraburkholderia caribensis TaxID=75105 RepID=UPI0034D1EC3D
MLFGRQVSVGLTSGRMGSFTLGRQCDVDADFVGAVGSRLAVGGDVGAHPGDLDNFNNTVRTNNSIKFKSLSYVGFSFGAMSSLGGVAGDVTRNQV